MPVSNKKIAYGYNEAIRHLKETQESFQLIVKLSQWVLRDHVPAGGLNMNMNLNLNQFVTALSENLFIVELSFWYATMDQPDRQSLNRLFQIDLPLHPSLKKVSFLQCQLNTKYVVLFAAALAAPVNNSKKPQLRDISLENTNLDLKGARALSNMLQNNACIECLTLNDCKVNSEGCRILFESLDGNSHLKELRLDSNAISKVTSTSVMALANAKNLQKLSLRNNQMLLRSEMDIQILLQGLRTNFSLRELDITRGNLNTTSPISAEPFEELLTTFNFTLHKVLVIDEPYYRKKQLPSPQQRVNDLLLQNGPVRKVHLALEKKRGRNENYRVPPRCLWPNTLGRISSKPSLLYRFVRMGNLDLFLQHQQWIHSHIPHQAQGLCFWNDKYFEKNIIEHVSNDIVTVCDVDYSSLRRKMIQHGWTFSGVHLYVLLVLYGMQKFGQVFGAPPIYYFLSSLIWLMLGGRLASCLYSVKLVCSTGFALVCLAALSCVHPMLPVVVIAILVLASGVYWRYFIYRILQEPHVALTHEGICYVSYVQGYFESIASNDSSTGTPRFSFGDLNLWTLIKPLRYGSDTMHIPYGTITACDVLVLRTSPEVFICVVTHTVDPENPTTKLYVPGLKKPFGFKRLVDSMTGLSSPC